jgi:hypothetical protein
MDNRSEGPTAPMPPQVEKASVMEDFMDMLYTPTKVYLRRAAGGTGLQLLIITVLSGLFAFASRSVFSQIFDAEFTRATADAIAKNPQSADAINSMRGIQEKIGMLFTYIGTPLFIFILGFFTWLASKVVSAKLTYGQALTVVTLAWIPRLVGSLAGVLQVVLMDTSNVTTPWALSISPARFLDPATANAKLVALLGGMDVFTIWYTVVVGIGIATIGKVSPAKGYTAAFIIFVLGLLPALMR